MKFTDEQLDKIAKMILDGESDIVKVVESLGVKFERTEGLDYALEERGIQYCRVCCGRFAIESLNIDNICTNCQEAEDALIGEDNDGEE